MNTLVKLHGQTAENQGGITMLKTNVNDFWTITKPENPRTTAEAESYINSVEDWNINDIENLQELDCILLAVDHEKIKEHDVYFINFKGGFDYSAVVFYNGAMIKYANLYQLHYHSIETIEELHNYYMKWLNNALFTDEELKQPLTDYNDYQKRTYYIRNYYPCRENYISAFQIFRNDEERTAYREAIKNLHYNSVTFGYYENAEFCKECTHLLDEVQEQLKAMDNDLQYWQDAFYHEFFNHECQYSENFEEAARATGIREFNEIQKKAFEKAIKKFRNYCYNHDCY